MYSFDEVLNYDPDLAKAMDDELGRQRSHIELIASENLVSKAVMAAMGSPLTNKYAEGYPGKRYYGGCEYVDVVETLAIERAKKLFGCEYANVQPHSGAQANLAVFFALVNPGDTVMGMSLDCGGHLSHGSPVNISGKYFNIVPYGVTADGFIDYDEVLRIAKECKPKMIIAGASAYARTIDFKKFREICDEVGALLMVDMAHIAGLVAGGAHPSPIPYADVTTTTTHKTLRGPRGGMILASAEAAEKFKLNKAVFPGIQGGPLMHVIAGKAVCLKEALDPSFKVYAENVVKNATALANGLMNRGFDIVSGGTDNHLMLVNLLSKGKTGKEVEKLLDAANITCNKNTIPNDPASPFVTSGIRLGTAAVTTRGFNEADMDVVAEAIAMLVDDVDANQAKAMELVKGLTDKLFGCEYANVQPHSGAQANLAVFFALVNPGDTVMGMSLDCGGHLSHGSPVNISGKYFNIVPYGVTADGFIDYDEVLRIAKECKPKMIIAGASAYARTIDFKKFREICDEVGALLMVDMAHIAGLVAGGAHPSPIPYADVTTTTTHKTLRGPRGGMILASAEAAEKFKLNKAVFPGIQGGPLMHVIAGKAVCLKEALDPSFKVYAENVVKNATALANGLMNRGFDIVSGGTDNHLMLVNLLSKGKTGKEVEKLLDAANITCNKNTIPNDPASPFVTSGIRLGTAAVTTRGFNEADMDVVAEAIAMLVDDVDANQAKAMELVKGLTDKYPLYE